MANGAGWATTLLYDVSIPRLPGCYILNHPASGAFYIGSTGNLKQREWKLMAGLNNGRDHNPRLQELYWDDPNVVYEYRIARDREEAYDMEQIEIDRWLGHPDCLNVNNNARTVWTRGTMSEERIRNICAKNTLIHSGQKYRLGQTNSDEQRQRQSDSIRSSWENRPRVRMPPRPVSVAGKIYDHAGLAAADVGCTRRTIIVRAADDRWPDYFYTGS